MSRRLDFVGRGPIIFERRELPEAAKLFEFVSFWERLPTDTQEWLMDLHYCWGRTRRLRSSRIVRHVDLVRPNLSEERVETSKRLRLRFPEAVDIEIEDTITEWRQSLDLIEESARSCPICEWTIIPQDECLDANLKLAIKMCRDGVFGAPPLSPDLAPGFEFRIRSLSRAKQLSWLQAFSDSFSTRNRWWARLKKSFLC